MVQKARLRGVNARNFDYLANDILRQCAKTDVRLLSRKAQAIILQKILQQLQAESRLSYYVRLLDKKGFLHSMLSLIGQLGRSNVTVQMCIRDSPGSDYCADDKIGVHHLFCCNQRH